MSILHIDIETGAERDLKKRGVYVYSEDPKARIWCMCYRFDDEPVQVWVPSRWLTPEFEWYLEQHVLPGLEERSPGGQLHLGALPERVRRHIKSGGEVRAFGAMFERTMINSQAICAEEIPNLTINQMVCVKAKCAANGIPQKLEKAAAALGTHAKDTTGAKAMHFFAKPRRVRGTKRGEPKVYDFAAPAEHPAKFTELLLYCVDDVLSECGVDHVLQDLSPKEHGTYQLDQRMNDRGWAVDLESVANIKEVVRQYRVEMAERCLSKTGLKPTQTKALKVWIHEHGYPQLENMRAHTVLAAVADKACPPDVKEILQLFSVYNMKAVAKYDAMERCVCRDGRVHGMFTYHGASPGRWCLTGDHEVLTPQGWERLDEWKGGRIMTWAENGRIDFEHADPAYFPYKGKMIQWDSQRFQQIATPDHKMPVLGHPGGVKVEDVHTKMKIPRCSTSTCSSRYTEQQLRFFVMAQADGHITESGSWRFSFTKPRKEERCRHILKWLGVEFRYNNYPNNKSNTRFVFEIPTRNMPKWMHDMGPNKDFPWELLFADHDVFFDELRHWDSHVANDNSFQYVTTNKHNADFVQAKAHIAGRQCNITEKKSGRKAHWAQAFYLSILDNDQPASSRNVGRSEIDYDGMVYCAKTPSGYFLVRRNGKCWITGNTAQLVQLQNLMRPLIKDAENAVEAFRARDIGWIRDLYSGPKCCNPMVVAASTVRSCLVAGPGKDLVFPDFSGVEARGIAWLFDEESELEIFRNQDAGTGPDAYRMTYGSAFGIRPQDVTPFQRQIGKVMKLSLGSYQGGPGAFVNMVPGYKIDLDEMTEAVWPQLSDAVLEQAHDNWLEAVHRKQTLKLRERVYMACDALKILTRNTIPGIVTGWYDIQREAIAAVEQPGTVTGLKNGKAMFKLEGTWPHQWLVMRLPSGRRIKYYQPVVKEIVRKNRHGEGRPNKVLTYMGIDTYTRQWKRTATYGGKLSQNWNEGHCRDLLVAAKFRLERKGYLPVGTIHDEPITEIDVGSGSWEEAKQIMLEVPSFSKGMPIAVEGRRSYRYGK